ncbi:acyl-CoA dehydrogenase family protein [Chelatococcus reniformis]|uniref:FMNH2-dependent monooxygenase n=1 Tax=Chelatococcus reniformis TaxID=1494448 RepID=A0A916TZ06_9HYPH|nr:acyl-CoA dehydrogenase family protein [Chelatococcus reniformis]GGC53277.1 FMNH2-dependent monooxygenase [Chelatococcus reniformis]
MSDRAETATIVSHPPVSWTATAEAVAAELRATAVAREGAGAAPIAEIELLRRAGLLTLLNPTEHGGGGGRFVDSFRVVRALSQADTNVGQLLSYHYLLSASAFTRALPHQRDALIRRSVDEQWFWGGASNPRDAMPVLLRDGEGFRLNGRKTFASNAAVADRITLRAQLGDSIVFIAAPGRAAGITHAHDWDAFGQRLTESGSVEFRDVAIARGDVLGPLPPPPAKDVSPAAALVVPTHQLYFVNFYIGTAEGALAEAKAYILSHARPWQRSGVAAAHEDPYVREHYGLLYADLRASLALADEAGLALQDAHDRGAALTQGERDAAAATVYAAKVHSTRIALDVTSRIFELMGARSAGAAYGFDRFWRNIRTHTLHDPVAYKAREVAEYAFTGTIAPNPLYN